MLKRLRRGAAIGAVASMLLSLPAAAHDPIFNWAGPYVGADFGGDFGESDSRVSTVFAKKGSYFASTSPRAIAAAGRQDFGVNGFAGGGEAGFNWQKGKFIYGAELGFDAMELNGSVSSTGLYPCCAPHNFTIQQSVSTSWLMTARPRVGVVFGKFLLTGSAGLAMTDMSYHSVFTDTLGAAHASGNISQVKMGWAAGTSLNYRLTRHWSLRLEYLFTDFGRVSTNSTNLTAATAPHVFPANKFSFNSSLESDIVRAGFNYRF